MRGEIPDAVGQGTARIRSTHQRRSASLTPARPTQFPKDLAQTVARLVHLRTCSIEALVEQVLAALKQDAGQHADPAGLKARPAVIRPVLRRWILEVRAWQGMRVLQTVCAHAVGCASAPQVAQHDEQRGWVLRSDIAAEYGVAGDGGSGEGTQPLQNGAAHGAGGCGTQK